MTNFTKFAVCFQAVHVMCVGEGPVVNVNPLALDWGDVPVLTDLEKTIVLSNESFIPAKFTAHMVKMLQKNLILA